MKTAKKQEILEFDPSKEDISKQNKQLLDNLISYNFINATIAGYMDKRSENWFKSWTEKFCVLTNVGLLYYDDPYKRPKNLFPTIDCQIKPIAEGKYNRKYVFLLKSFNYEIIFAARQKEEYERWIKAFARLQVETEKKKKDIIQRNAIRDNSGGDDEAQKIRLKK